DDGGDVGQLHRRAVAVGDDERAVVVAGQELVVGGDRVRQARAVEVALGLVDVGGGDRGADVVEVQTVGREQGGIGLDAHRRLLPAADAHQADAGQLRDLLRQPR